MLKSKKLLVFVIGILFILSMLLTSCSSKTEESDDGSQSSPQESNTNASPDSFSGEKIKIVHFTTSSEDKLYIKDLMTEFEKTHSNIEMEFSTVPYDNFDTQLSTMIASGNAPDVTSHYGNGGFIEYLDKGMIEDLTPLMSESKFNASEIGIPEDLMKIYNINGKQYGIPASCYVSVLAYNKDMMDKANLAYPPSDYEDKSWTFEKMVDYAKKLTKISNKAEDSQYGIDWMWSEKDMLPLYFNTKIYSDDTWVNGGYPTSCYFNSPGVITAYKKLNDLIYKDKVMAPPDINQKLLGTSGADSPFYIGRYGMLVSGSWILYGTEDLPFKLGIAAIPAYKDSKSRDVIYVDPLMLLKGSSHPKEAFEWIKFMVSKEAQEKAIDGGNPPANTFVFEKYYNSVKGVDSKDMKNVVEGGIKYGAESYNHLISNYSEILETVKSGSAPMDSNSASVEDSCNSIQSKVTEIISKMEKQ